MSLHPAVLSSLQVFCAVVKHESFSEAAKSLNITQSAVSHRMKQLEDILGLSLIERSTRHLRITENGARLARTAQTAINDIEGVLEYINRAQNNGPISISTISALATKWLLPNLTRYNQKHPKHPISVMTDERVLDLRRENIDGAVRFAKSVDDTDLDVTFICHDLIVPVASPSLNLPAGIMNNPEALLNHPLLSVVGFQVGYKGYSWESWFEAQNKIMPQVNEGSKFNRTDIAMQAVIAGQGIGLTRASFLEIDMLETGLLVQVGKAVPSQHSYHFVCLPENANLPAIVSFRGWLIEEMGKTYDRVAKKLYI
ncbi:MAG: LysR family transcriptional regulator [Sphingomonadales bacterium]|nr:LysR family transcriptional regulator [Sphingomonadales bacterium]